MKKKNGSYYSENGWNKHDNRFYPDFSGVAKSYNFYPVPPQKQNDGIVSVALGLGKTVVDGGNTVRFCPKYPTDLIQFYSVEETLNNSQIDFYALDLEGSQNYKFEIHDVLVKKYNLNTSEKDGTLHYVGSTYSPRERCHLRRVRKKWTAYCYIRSCTPL